MTLLGLKKSDFLGFSEHLLYVSVLFFLSFLFTPPALGPKYFDDYLSDIEFRQFGLFLLMTSIFYLNLYVLMPYLWRKKRWWYYSISILGIILLFLIISTQLPKQHRHPSHQKRPFREHLIQKQHRKPPRPNENREKPLWLLKKVVLAKGFSELLIVLFFSMTIYMYKDRQQQLLAKKQRETEFFKSETELLRSQISPHFIFNMLNTLLSLSHNDNKKLSEVIIKLSEMMRYMLYSNSKITLEEEIVFIKNYIHLHRIRMGKIFDVKIDFHIEDKSKTIEPMLIIPLLENALKYGCLMVDVPEISMGLKADSEHMVFEVENIFLPEASSQEKGGIGLKNIMRRLVYLYPNRHKLITNVIGNKYKSKLILYF